MTESIRLAKRVADLFSCSRREAQLYIEGGWVAVDGNVVEEPGAPIAPQQEITLLPGFSAEAVPPVTLLLHRPAGVAPCLGMLPPMHGLTPYLTPANLDLSGSTGFGRTAFLKRHLHHLNACTALEESASGLLVLTQDFHIERKLSEDGATLEQEYVVEVAGDLAPAQIATLLQRQSRLPTAPLC